MEVRVADFKRLGYFVQIAELGSLTRAAERLRIAQPSLSRQMRLLEEELGVTLFTRGHRGMQLTEAGEALRARIAGPLRQIGHTLYEIRSLPTETGGTVILGMPPTVIGILAVPLLQRLVTEAPKIALQVVEAQSGHLLEWMKRGDLDAAILYGPTPAGLNATRLLDDELVLVGPADFPLAAKGSVKFKLLAELPLLLPSDTHGLRVALETAAAKARTQLNITAQIDSVQLRKDLVEQGGGLTILPPSSFLREAAEGRLTYTRITNPILSRQLFIAMQSGAESPRAILQVEEFLRQEVARMVREGHWPSAKPYGVGDS
jgi:DNA-binding transcriptional LysR family regulator